MFDLTGFFSHLVISDVDLLQYHGSFRLPHCLTILTSYVIKIPDDKDTVTQMLLIMVILENSMTIKPFLVRLNGIFLQPANNYPT